MQSLTCFAVSSWLIHALASHILAHFVIMLIFRSGEITLRCFLMLCLKFELIMSAQCYPDNFVVRVIIFGLYVFFCILLFLGDTFRVQNNIIVVDGFLQNLARWQIEVTNFRGGAPKGAKGTCT